MIVKNSAKIQPFEKNISDIRQLAADTQITSDQWLCASVWAAIYVLTREDADFNMAHDFANLLTGRAQKAKTLAVIGRSLAEDGKFGVAKSLAVEIQHIDRFWHAQIRIWIWRFSGNGYDHKKAQEAVMDVIAPDPKSHLKADLEIANAHPHITGKPKERHMPKLKMLQRALSHFSASKDAHVAPRENPSVFWYFKILEICEGIYADSFCESQPAIFNV